MKRFVLFLLFIFPVKAIADSDGVFCVGDGYVALETRGLYIAEEKSNTNGGVFIIFVGNNGISERIFVQSKFKDGGNNQIACEKDRVILSNGIEANSIDISGNEPKVSKVELPENIQYSEKQLPFINKSDIIKIPSDTKDDSYWLLINYYRQGPASPPLYKILHHFSAKVIKLNKHGHPIDWKHLAYGITEESYVD
jgi:hypothetical protein